MVQQLSVHTVEGSVAGSGEQMMLIVPLSDALVVESKIAPKDIDKIEL